MPPQPPQRPPPTYNQEAYGALSPWQQKVLTNALPLAAGQRTDPQKAVMDAYRAQLANLGVQHPQAPTAPGVPAPPGAPGGGPGWGNEKWATAAGGMSPTEWFGQLGYDPGWVRKHMRQGGVGPYDYAPISEEGKLFLLEKGYGQDWADLPTALADLEIPTAFAGREQFLRNLSDSLDVYETEPNRGGQKLPDWLQDLSGTTTFSEDPGRTTEHVLSRTLEGLRGGQDLAGQFAKQRELVPEWATRVRDALKAQNVPFSLELLNSPGLNLTDTSKPLFGEGEAPLSLGPFGSMQAGERALLRGLTAEELMMQLQPLMHRYHHRPAGAPVPEGMEGGLTFGSPAPVEGGRGNFGGGLYNRSPVMGTPAYERHQAYGMPGDPTQNGMLQSHTGLASFVPLTGEYKQMSPEDAVASGALDARIRMYTQMTGQPPSRTQIEQWITQGLPPAIQQNYWAEGGQYAPYQNIDDATRQRLMALLGPTAGPQ